jgi:hypothetical protein
VQEKKRKQRTLSGAAERERPFPSGSRKRPEEMEVETRSRTRRSIVRRHSPSGQRSAPLTRRFRRAYPALSPVSEPPQDVNSERCEP